MQTLQRFASNTTAWSRALESSCLQGHKTKGALKGWGNLSSSMTATPTGPLTTPTSGQKSRDTSSAFATFQKAAKEKADRSEAERIIIKLTVFVSLNIDIALPF